MILAMLLCSKRLQRIIISVLNPSLRQGRREEREDADSVLIYDAIDVLGPHRIMDFDLHFMAGLNELVPIVPIIGK